MKNQMEFTILCKQSTLNQFGIHFSIPHVIYDELFDDRQSNLNEYDITEQ